MEDCFFFSFHGFRLNSHFLACRLIGNNCVKKVERRIVTYLLKVSLLNGFRSSSLFFALY
jgi:hypothetical protein